MDLIIEKMLLLGLITHEDLKKALSHQWKYGGNILSILVELGFIDEEDYLEFIKKEIKAHTVKLKEIDFEPDVHLYIPKRIAYKYLIVPIKRVKRSLVCAMVNPLSKRALKELSFVTDLEIVPLASKPSEILESLRNFYGEWKPNIPFDFLQEIPNLTQTLSLIPPRHSLYQSIITLAEDITERKHKIVLLVGARNYGKSFLVNALANYVKTNSPQPARTAITSGQLIKEAFLEVVENGLYYLLRELTSKYSHLFIDDFEKIYPEKQFENFVKWFTQEKQGVLVLTSEEEEKVDIETFTVYLHEPIITKANGV